MATIVATNLNLVLKTIEFIAIILKMQSDMYIDVLFEILLEKNLKLIFGMKNLYFPRGSPMGGPRGLASHF